MAGGAQQSEPAGSRPGDRSSRREIDALDVTATIRALSAAHRTGLLTVTGPDGEQRQLYFLDGLLKMVASPAQETDTLEEALLGSKSFTREEIDLAREEARRAGKSLAQVLIERGADAGQALDSRTRREAARILSWRKVNCEFREGAGPDRGVEPYAARLGGGIDAESLLGDIAGSAGQAG